MTNTNANFAAVAAALEDGKVGTFTGLVTRKRGAERGRGADKKTYGDDLVHVVLVTGFSYRRLCERSLEELTDLDLVTLANSEAKKGLVGYEGRGKNAVEVPVTLADFEAAKAELAESLAKSEAGLNESTSDHVYESLVVGGVTVRGGRVYRCCKDDADHECRCRDCTGDKKAPLNGTVFLQGLKVGETVLEPAANGPLPASKSAPKTVAKHLLRRYLPVARYVSYRLEPGTEFRLAVGGTAVLEADKAGVKPNNVASEVA